LLGLAAGRHRRSGQRGNVPVSERPPSVRCSTGIVPGTAASAAKSEIAALELTALLELAIREPSRGPGEHGNALLSALKAVADTAGRTVGHESVQLHGGMGVSDELSISHYARRLATIRAELGGADLHRQRFGTDVAIGDLLELQDSVEARAWRQSVREFTRTHLPERIALKGRLGLKADKEDYVGWQKILHEHGLFGDAWPREYGGADWDLVKQLVFAQESSVCDAPMISPYGVSMVGPVIYTFGTDEQKRKHLPGILSSDVWWCQGYSEPGAGSDLASLKTAAELDGDHYVVNGAKLWTTEAHWADWMHCLVRTDRSGKPQAGITFLLIDMRTPGITIKPILTIDGLHHTNALFLDNVRVPAANRVGEEGRGWEIATLLGNERVSIAIQDRCCMPKRVHEIYRAADARPIAARDARPRRGIRRGLHSAAGSVHLERRCVEAWCRRARGARKHRS
jgi:alkylation response protein AidB-like acyl-CoA dehydrogenase